MSHAALNNAEWCDAMCRAHGLPGVFTPRAWTNPVRTPLFYPDAVTLSPTPHLTTSCPRSTPAPARRSRTASPRWTCGLRASRC